VREHFTFGPKHANQRIRLATGKTKLDEARLRKLAIPTGSDRRPKVERAKEALFTMKDKRSTKGLQQGRKRHHRADDFDLFAKAFRTVAKDAMRLLETSGRKEENLAYWRLRFLNTLTKDWPKQTREQRELLARARNIAQMFVFGSWWRTRQLDSARRRLAGEIAKNPNWPNPPPRRRAQKR
jgi:hypothetical protein